MPLVGFEPTISAGERPKTYALDRAATGTGIREGNVEKTRKKKGTFSEEDWPISVSILIKHDGNPIIPRCHVGTYITLSR